MKHVTIAVGWVALALALTGCATTPPGDQPQAIGKTVTFATKESAPTEFDSWTFIWTFPAVERFDADLQYLVLMPDGGDPYVHDCGLGMVGVDVRSDFWPTMFSEFGKPERDLITPFHGKPITIVVRATRGRIRFARPEGFIFAFFKKGQDGKIDYSKSIKKIKAVMTLG